MLHWKNEETSLHCAAFNVTLCSFEYRHAVLNYKVDFSSWFVLYAVLLFPPLKFHSFVSFVLYKNYAICPKINIWMHVPLLKVNEAASFFGCTNQVFFRFDSTLSEHSTTRAKNTTRWALFERSVWPAYEAREDRGMDTSAQLDLVLVIDEMRSVWITEVWARF